MACLSVKQFSWGLTGGLPVRRRSLRPPAITSFSMKNCTSKGFHISSFAKGFSSAKAKNRGFDCSCSAESTPAGDKNTEPSGESTPAVHENTELLDFLFFKPEPYNLPRWNLKVFFTAFCYGAYTIHSKMLLNSFPCPWLLSTAYVALGFLTFAYISGDLPIDSGFWKSLFPVAVAHTIGLAAEMVSLSKLPADSTHIIRCAEPVFTVLLSMLFGGQSFPLPVYLSLLPIVAGCALAVSSDLNFNTIGFITAMIANLGFAFTNFLAGKGMKEEGVKVTPLQYYGSLLVVFLDSCTIFLCNRGTPEVGCRLEDGGFEGWR